MTPSQKICSWSNLSTLCFHLVKFKICSLQLRRKIKVSVFLQMCKGSKMATTHFIKESCDLKCKQRPLQCWRATATLPRSAKCARWAQKACSVKFKEFFGLVSCLYFAFKGVGWTCETRRAPRRRCQIPAFWFLLCSPRLLVHFLDFGTTRNTLTMIYPGRAHSCIISKIKDTNAIKGDESDEEKWHWSVRVRSCLHFINSI